MKDMLIVGLWDQLTENIIQECGIESAEEMVNIIASKVSRSCD